MSGSTAHDFRRLTHARVKVAGSWRGLRRGQERHLTPQIACETDRTFSCRLAPLGRKLPDHRHHVDQH